MPIYTWVIDHPEGIIVVDTGETSKSSDPDYYPHWHPYYRGSLSMNVRPEDEIGPQLGSMWIMQEDIKTLILTHFHTDHAGGLHPFPGTKILVSGTDYRLARGLGGRLRGYLPNRWPKWFSPEPIAFEAEKFGPSEQSYKVTQAGDVLIVPTPGHTPGHVSVIVNTEDAIFFLAGDASYSESFLIKRMPDGVSPRASIAIDTKGQICRVRESRKTQGTPRRGSGGSTGRQTSCCVDPTPGSRSGDMERLLALLSEDIAVYSGGGGKATAVRTPIRDEEMPPASSWGSPAGRSQAPRRASQGGFSLVFMRKPLG